MIAATAGGRRHSAPRRASLGVKPPEGTIRVDVGLLDRLMDLVGELVLARDQIVRSQGTPSPM